MIICILNQKGGVGKTSIAVNLSYALSVLNKKTLLIDLDPQANSSVIFCPEVPSDETVKEIFLKRRSDIRKLIRVATINEVPAENLSLIPSSMRLMAELRHIDGLVHREKILSKHLLKINSEYDFILLDCPPQLNVLTTNAIYASEFLLIPTQLDRYSLDGIADLFDSIDEIKEESFDSYRIVINSYDKREKVSNRIALGILEDFEDYLSSTKIRRASVIKQAQQYNLPVACYTSSKTSVVQDYSSLAQEIINYAK